MTLSARHKAQHARDFDLVHGALSEREAQLVSAATRLAYDRVGDWLSTKQAKSEQFPGGDLAAARARASAYQNAAQAIYYWAIRDGETQ